MRLLLTVGLGFLFGSILIASEAFHWYRIQEMFHFDSFHMFGVLFSAIATAAISLGLIKRFKVRTVHGNKIKVTPKQPKRFGNFIGGLFFGMGWALTGACTAPVLILVGLKWEIGLITLAGVLIGSLFFASINSKLPR